MPTKIEWCEESWNPLRARNKETGAVGHFCIHASDGCRLCYAETWQNRLGTKVPYKAQWLDQVDLFLDEKTLAQPSKWRRPKTIFVCSMTDLFLDHYDVLDVVKVIDTIRENPRHVFIVVTKRPRVAGWYLSELFADGFPPNMWLLTSVEDQENADRRLPELVKLRASVLGVSAEPLLGPINLRPWLDRLGWIITGGESGSGARAANPQWFRDIRDQCIDAGVAYFHKQNGEYASVSEVEGPGQFCTFDDDRTVRRVGKKRAGRLLDGRTWDEMPTVP